MDATSMDGPGSDERLAMLAALVAGDVNLAHRLATELLAQGISLLEIADEVLAPVQVDVGSRWATGDLSIAQEHAASTAVGDVLVRLAATAEEPVGPTVVVAAPEHELHVLGGRVIASWLTLEGFRVQFLGPSLPASDLEDFLDVQPTLALILSCSMPTALTGAARAVDAAHRLGVPVLGGGGALATPERAARLGVDGFSMSGRQAVELLRAWEQVPPPLAVAAQPIPEHDVLAEHGAAIVASALAASPSRGAPEFALVDELWRMLHVIESSLLVDEPALAADHIDWLRTTAPAHGLERACIDVALDALAATLESGVPRAGRRLRQALR